MLTTVEKVDVVMETGKSEFSHVHVDLLCGERCYSRLSIQFFQKLLIMKYLRIFNT